MPAFDFLPEKDSRVPMQLQRRATVHPDRGEQQAELEVGNPHSEAQPSAGGVQGRIDA